MIHGGATADTPRRRQPRVRLLIACCICCALPAGLLANARPAAARPAAVTPAAASTAAAPATVAPRRDPSYSPGAQRAAALRPASVGAATFDPDNLITDINFTAVDTLSGSAVQTFLAAQTGVLASYQAADHNGVTRSASAIVAQAARGWSVSPKVILATLQKEQGLLSAVKPSATALDWAMGCGVPDGGARNTAYKGFGKQIWYGAESLHDDGQGWYAGIAKVCGDGTVQPDDQASYSLYRYTPWIGLNGGGNKLFWTLYWEYFGDPLAVDAVAPTTTVAGADALWHDGAVALSFSALDNTGGTGVAYSEYSLDTGATWTKGNALTIPAPADHSGDGLHTVLYRSADDAGNLEKARSCTVKIDTRAPVTSVAGANSRWQRKAKTLTFRAADNAGGSGVAFTLVKLDKGPWTKATTLTIPAPADHSGDGLHTVFYRSVDEAGNREAAHTCAVRIDTRPPRTVANWAASVRRGNWAGLTYYVSDPRPGSPTATVTIRVKTSSGRLVRKLRSVGVAVDKRLVARFVCRLAPGRYRFFVYATDAAGNGQSKVGSNKLTVR
jgi:hypothetical protein